MQTTWVDWSQHELRSVCFMLCTATVHTAAIHAAELPWRHQRCRPMADHQPQVRQWWSFLTAEVCACLSLRSSPVYSPTARTVHRRLECVQPGLVARQPCRGCREVPALPDACQFPTRYGALTASARCRPVASCSTVKLASGGVARPSLAPRRRLAPVGGSCWVPTADSWLVAVPPSCGRLSSRVEQDIGRATSGRQLYAWLCGLAAPWEVCTVWHLFTTGALQVL